MEQILNEYYKDNAKKLREKVDKMLNSFGGLSEKDYHDFYSLANIVFVDVMKRYDGIQPFDGLLHTSLDNKIKTEMTRRNRKKRQADRKSVSIDTPIGENTGTTLGNTIASNINVENEIKDDKVERYLESLSKLQRKIIEMKMNGLGKEEIKEILGLSDKEYNNNMKQAIEYEHIKILDLEI